MKLRFPRRGPVSTPRDKPLPPRYKFQVACDWTRRFGWRERFKILFGYRAVIILRMTTEHHTGKFEADLHLALTPEMLERTKV